MKEPTKAEVRELLHAAGYDPAKRREYYLRTRVLTGRKTGTFDKDKGRHYYRQLQNLKGNRGPSDPPRSNKDLRPSRREELLQQRKQLEARLEYLQEALANAVKAAKRRSGVKEKPDSTKVGTVASKEKAGKKDSGTSSDKPLTAAQKREKAKADAERYEKEQKTGLATEVQHLQDQCREIRARLDKALADARAREQSQSKPQTASKGR